MSKCEMAEELGGGMTCSRCLRHYFKAFGDGSSICPSCRLVELEEGRLDRELKRIRKENERRLWNPTFSLWDGVGYPADWDEPEDEEPGEGRIIPVSDSPGGFVVCQ